MRSADADTPSGSARTTATRPRTEEELLELEEQRALAGIVETADCLVTDLTQTRGLADAVRRHPAVTAAVAAVGGAVAGRLLAHAGRAALNAYLARPGAQGRLVSPGLRRASDLFARWVY